MIVFLSLSDKDSSDDDSSMLSNDFSDDDEEEDKQDSGEEEQRRMITRSQAKRMNSLSRKTRSVLTPPTKSRPLKPGKENGGFKRPRYNRAERDFLDRAPKKMRQHIIKEEMRIWQASCEKCSLDAPMRFRILESEMPMDIKARAIRQVEENNGGDMSAKTLHWLNALLSIPFGRYVNPHDGTGAVKKIKEHLDSAVYGHSDTKDQIIRLIAQWIVNPNGRGMAIGIGGPPGVGKTHLCQALCDCLSIPFGFIPLGGASGGCYIDGHSSTYEGSTWGRIADTLMKTKCMNPVLFFDELDKVSESHHGAEVSNLLIHLTDPAQNNKFNDKFFGIDLDLSRSLMLFSYNDSTNVNPILMDRLVTIRASGYSVSDKIAIARKHLIPGLEKEFADTCKLHVEDDVLRYIIGLSGVCEEQGVRALRRALYDVLSHVNFDNLTKGETRTTPVTRDDVDRFLSKNGGRGSGTTSGPMSDSVKAMYL